MVAYNFKERFVEQIKTGLKCQTIRKNRVRPSRHALPGEMMNLYGGQRTVKCKLICAVRCTLVLPVQIFIDTKSVDLIRVSGHYVDNMNVFAQADGFRNLDDMHKFWFKAHGLGLFNGTIIHWAPPSEPAEKAA